MNPLNKYPRVREVCYFLQWVVNGVLALAGAYFAVIADGMTVAALPEWYAVTLACAPVLWTYLGLTAQANVFPADRYHPED